MQSCKSQFSNSQVRLLYVAGTCACINSIWRVDYYFILWFYQCSVVGIMNRWVNLLLLVYTIAYSLSFFLYILLFVAVHENQYIFYQECFSRGVWKLQSQQLFFIFPLHSLHLYFDVPFALSNFYIEVLSFCLEERETMGKIMGGVKQVDGCFVSQCKAFSGSCGEF